MDGNVIGIEVVKEWQTLLAGLLALLGAVITVFTMERQSRDMRKRRHLAARAVMPADLSEICAYSEQCAALIDKALHYYDKHQEPPPDLKAPTLPDRIPANFQMLIEQVNKSNAHAIADLLSCYQVQRGRLEGALREWSGNGGTRVTTVFSRENVEHPLIETIRLRASADAMFDFARREADSIPQTDSLSAKQFGVALRLLMGPGFPSTDRDKHMVENMKMSLGVPDADDSNG